MSGTEPGALRYTPSLRHTKWSRKPDWQDQTAKVLATLRDQVGGVPHAALYVAGLLRSGSGRTSKPPAELEQGIQDVLGAAWTADPIESMTEQGARKPLQALIEQLGLKQVEIRPSTAARGQMRMRYYVPAAEAVPKAAAYAVDTELRKRGGAPV